jgi:4-hydroxybenzoate polyprenyltransferase
VDRLKEEIGWLKVIFAILVATAISLIAWLVQNYTMANPALLICCGVSVVVLAIAIIRINGAASRKIKALEDL